MRKILILASVVAITMAALHSEAAGAPICRSAHTAASMTKPAPQEAPGASKHLKNFSDVMDLRVYDAIWLQVKKEMLVEISALPKEDQEHIKKMAEGIQNYTDVLMGKSIKWKKRNGTKENSVIYNYRSRMDDLKEELRVGTNRHNFGTHDPAVGLYKELFHDFEQSYLALTANLKEMNTLEKYGRSIEEIRADQSLKGRIGEVLSPEMRRQHAGVRLEQLRRENRKLYRILGRGIDEYTLVRLYLESVSKEDSILLTDPVFTLVSGNGVPVTPPAEIAAYARDVLSQLGVSGVEQRSPLVDTLPTRIPVDDILNLYVRTPEIQIEKLQFEYASNVEIFVRSASVIVFANYIRKIVTKFPNEGKFRFIRHSLEMFTGLIERRYVEHRYLPQIRDIVYAENDLHTQYSILRRHHDDAIMTDEFLVSFARVSFYSSHWSSLRKYAEQIAGETGNHVDADLVARMKNAEIEAAKLGTFSPGKSDAKGALMRIGSATISTLLIAHQWDNIVGFFLGATGLATETAKFVCSTCGF